MFDGRFNICLIFDAPCWLMCFDHNGKGLEQIYSIQCSDLHDILFAISYLYFALLKLHIRSYLLSLHQSFTCRFRLILLVDVDPQPSNELIK